MNVRKLLAKMAENGITRTILSNKAGICIRTLRERMRGESEWKQSEILRIASILNLSPQDIVDIFFTQLVS